jgi:protein-tyrosine phosphatase
MIDLHAHILPGLDDGAKNMDEALEMCRMAQADGIHTIVATPHYRIGLYENSQANILPALEGLQQALHREGISIRLLPGVDIFIHPEVIPFLEQNPLLLIGGRYALMELPNQSIPPHLPDFFFKMRLKGYIPIITHPERNGVVQGNPEILEELVKGGALLQATAMSLTGEFGVSARETATRLIRSGLVQSIATDAHSPHRRPPVLSKARRILEEMIRPDQASVVMDQIPEKILRGELVEGKQITESPPYRPSLISRLFKRKV